MPEPMKVWRLTPDQVADYKPGQDLGEPHEIKFVKSDLERSREAAKAHQERQRRSSERRMQGMIRLTKPIYEKEVAAGLNDAQIAEKYGIQRSTMYHYKSLFRKGLRAK